MVIKYIIYINESTGEIQSIVFPQNKVPSEGLIKNDSVRVVHVTEETLPEGCNDLRYFMDNFIYNGTDFVNVGKKPNEYAKWDLQNNKWKWSSSFILNDIKKVRNRKLGAADWTQIPDNSLTSEQKEEARIYRQNLRDFPSTLDMDAIQSVNDVIWPTPPSFL